VGEVRGGEGSGRRPRVRIRTLRRWGPPFLAGLLLVSSLAAVVRRTEEGRRLSGELDRLEAEQLVLQDRVAEQVARVESLTALPRLEQAAGDIGLRQAEDGEVFHISDLGAGVGEPDDRSGGDREEGTR